MNNRTHPGQTICTDHKSFRVTGIPVFNDNLVWVLQQQCDNGDRPNTVCIVDPGDAVPVIDYCRRHQLVPTTILLTHHHADHTGGVADIQGWMRQMHPTRPVVIYGPAVEEIPAVNHPLAGGELIPLWPGIHAEVLAVAGHTRGHLAYFVAGDAGCKPPALFSGDLIFGLGCGRLFEGTAEQMYAALMRVAQLDPDTRIYCAHEYTALNLPFALKVDAANLDLMERGSRIRALREAGDATLPLLLREELATNPFLRCAQPALATAICAEPQATPSQIFAELRRMRDTFKAAKRRQTAL